MKAQILHAIGDIRLEEIEKPVPKEGEVIIKVKAAGICGSDIPRIYKTGTYHYPLIPGHEFSGEVVELGDRVDSKWKGKAVGIFPLIPCKACNPCKQKKYEMCKHYNYLGSRTAGGFAEYVAVPEWNLLELPDVVTYEQAAMLEPMAVAVHAMRQIAPMKEETVAVCGLGTIGMLLSMFLLDAEIEKLLVIGNKKFQKEQAIKLGISEKQILIVDSNVNESTSVKSWVLDHTEGLGVDVFFECVGKNETVIQGMDVVAAGGRMQLVGNPASDMIFPKDVYWKILRSQLTVKGTWNSSYTGSSDDDWHYVLERLVSGNIHPEEFITGSYALSDLQKGLEVMRDKSRDYLKEMMLEK